MKKLTFHRLDNLSFPCRVISSVLCCYDSSRSRNSDWSKLLCLEKRTWDSQKFKIMHTKKLTHLCPDHGDHDALDFSIDATSSRAMLTDHVVDFFARAISIALTARADWSFSPRCPAVCLAAMWWESYTAHRSLLSTVWSMRLLSRVSQSRSHIHSPPHHSQHVQSLSCSPFDFGP